jgi:hypothetical protein
MSSRISKRLLFVVEYFCYDGCNIPDAFSWDKVNSFGLCSGFCSVIPRRTLIHYLCLACLGIVRSSLGLVV